MIQNERAYIAGIGMITPVGVDSAMTSAAVKAGISAYQLSEFEDVDGNAVRMANVPEDIFQSFSGEIDEGDYYSDHYDHVIKMAIIAMRESLSTLDFNQPVPLFMGLPEPLPDINHISRKSLVTNLLKAGGLPISNDSIRTFCTGRASGIQAIELALRYFSTTNAPYVLIGGSDSYCHFPLIRHLSNNRRLLTENASDGFVPGEAAGFVLLTSSVNNALVVNGHAVAVHEPGLAQEAGHLYSEQVYQGAGLAQAFSDALGGVQEHSIGSIYSSINGEHFWAKEMGVATIRNSHYLKPDYIVEHPVDCLGDMGAATSPVLIGLAAMDLLMGKQINSALVYSSSDTAWRGAVRLQKIAVSQTL